MTPDKKTANSSWPATIQRLAIWFSFFVLIYLIRNFFFLAFMTFLFSFMALNVVGWLMRRLSPGRDRPTLRKLFVFCTFLTGPVLVLAIGLIVAPKLIAQGQRFASWVGQMNPETEAARLVESVVGPLEFRREYGGPGDPRYQMALKKFLATGDRRVAEYLEFPTLESWIEAGFRRQFADAEGSRERARLLALGPTNHEFQEWLVWRKSDSTPPAGSEALGQLRKEWIATNVAHAMAKAHFSPEFDEQFRNYYDERRIESPKSVPYTFDQFIELRAARAQGRHAFAEALDRIQPSGTHDVANDFEIATRHELFLAWWGSSTAAKFVRKKVESGVVETVSARTEQVLLRLLNVPLDLATAMLLSFFVCIDFPRLQRGCRSLNETWLHDVYAELAPALSSLAILVGRALQAQGLVAACNASIIFISLTMLGVEHAVALSAAVFILCLVPTLGMILAWVLLATVALVQPGGGFVLAFKVTAAVFAVVALEIFVFSPRILGRMMELHPVLIIALLPVAQYFFGVWGLILATPIAVFVINEVIFEKRESIADANGVTVDVATNP